MMKLTRRSKTLLQQNQVLTKASVASMVETALSPSKPLNDLTGNTVGSNYFFDPILPAKHRCGVDPSASKSEKENIKFHKLRHKF